MIRTNWITPPVFEPATTTSQMRAKRIIAVIKAAPNPQTTAQINAALCITVGQFNISKPYLRAYKLVGLRWHPLEKVEEAKALYAARKRVLQDASNSANTKKRKNDQTKALSA